jgi:abortive infection alpha-like protein
MIQDANGRIPAGGYAMSDDNKIRDAAQVVKAVVEAVPVYQDVVQPAARQVGKGLETVAKTIHVALAPLAALVWGYETMAGYLGEALSKRLKGVPPERIITPQATVAGPALDALKYAGPDPDLRELYANLLARAMDQRTALMAHPAFVEILRQLTPDEARILKAIAERESIPVLSVTSQNRSDGSYNWVLHRFSTLGEEAGCAFQALTPTYLDNLLRLGLLELHEDKRDATPGAYDGLRAHASVVEAMKQAQAADGSRTPHVLEQVLVVTSLGRQFCDAVVKPIAA